jgi:hypothetical protein
MLRARPVDLVHVVDRLPGLLQKKMSLIGISLTFPTHRLEAKSTTSPDNLRSQAVIKRLQMRRDPSRDFVVDHAAVKDWKGLVWEATRAG